MLRCMRELKAGTVWFNDPLTDNDAGPFGGFKQSGLGRELGREGLEAFQETKHVHIETEIEAKEWWYPTRSTADGPHDGQERHGDETDAERCATTSAAAGSRRPPTARSRTATRRPES